MATNQQQKLLDMVMAGVERIAQTSMTGIEASLNPALNLSKQRQNVAEKAITDRLMLPTMDVPEIPENELLQQAEGIAQQQMSGEIPDDVRDEVMRLTAEMAVQGGIAPSQFASNFTAASLGLTSYEIQNQGVDNASRIAQGQAAYDTLRAQTTLGVAQINNAAIAANEEMNLRWSSLNEQNREWDQKFGLSLLEYDLNKAALQLKALEINGNLQLGMDRIMADLMINDANAAIPGVSDLASTMNEGILGTQQYIQDWLEGL